MQVGLIADAEIRNSDKYPAVTRLADLPGAGGLALCCKRRRAGRDMLVGLPLAKLGGSNNPHIPAEGRARRMQPIVDHIQITVRDMSVAVPFYDKLLALLGFSLQSKTSAVIDTHEFRCRVQPPAYGLRHHVSSKGLPE